MIRVSEQALISFEQELNGVKYDGIPLGGTVVNLLYIELLNGGRKWSFKERLHDAVSVYNQKYRGRRSFFLRKTNTKTASWVANNNGKAIITFINGRHHMFNMNYQVWKVLGNSNCICYTGFDNISVCFQEGENPEILFKKNLPEVSFKNWKKDFSGIEQNLSNAIKQFLKQNRLPNFVGRRIFSKIIEQTQHIYALNIFLTKLKPKYILTEFDRHHFCSPLVLVGKKIGVPTYSLMHGVVNNRFGYLPLLADNLLCWGSQQKQLLINYGANKEQVTVTGAPQFSNLVEVSKTKIKERIGLDITQKVIVLATNPMSQLERTRLVNIFCAALKGMNSWKGVVRLHPSENIELYSSFMLEYNHILFDKNQILSFDETLAVTDLVCIFNSAFGLNALFKKVPVSVINVNKELLGQGFDLINAAGLYECKTTEELRGFICKWEENRNYRNTYQKKCDTYANDYCSFFGAEAASRTLEFINSRLDRSTKKGVLNN